MMKLLLASLFFFCLSIVQVAQAEETASVEQAITTQAQKVSEADIPVQLDAKKSEGAETSSTAKMMFSLFIVVGMGAAGFLAFRKYKFTNIKARPEAQLKILTQHHLGPKKSLAVIRIAGESMLIGITEHHISMIKSLSLLDEEIPEETPTAFSQTLRRSNGKGATSVEGEPSAEPEEFSFAGIRDVVTSRLKNMRSFE